VDPYIVVKGSFHRFNSIGLEVVDSRAAIHVAGQPLLPVSSDPQAWDTLVNRCMNVAAKYFPEPTKSVAGRPTHVPH
jgi:hypothetical protein